MPRRVQFEGKTHEFPDDASDDDIRAALEGGAPKPQAPTQTTPMRGSAALSRGVSPALQEKRKAAVQGLIKTATPVVDNPIVNAATYPLRSGVTQAASGVVRASQPGLDNKLGGAADIAEGAMTAAAPMALPAMGRALVANPLKTVGGFVAGALTTPAVRMAAPAMGLGPGATQLASDIAGLYAGNKVYNALPKKQPKIPEYKEAPFLRILDPSKNEENTLINRHGTGTYQKAFPEIRDTDKAVTKAVENWSGEQGSFTEYLAKEVGPKAQQRFYDTYDQIVAPVRDRIRVSGKELADELRAMVPQDIIRGPHSQYVSNLISNLEMSEPSIRDLETLRESINSYTAPLKAKSAAGQSLATRQDTADVGALDKLGAIVREKLYGSIEAQQPGAGEAAAEAMRKYGAVKEATDQIAGLITAAQKGSTPTDAHRARLAAKGGLEATAGFKHAAIASFLRAFGAGEDTIDRALMKAFSKYDVGPTPMPLDSPVLGAALPLNRRLAAPTGPVGVSGVTVPDVAGQVTTNANKIAAGPRMLPAPTLPVGVSGTTMPDARGQIIDLVNQETSGQRMLPPATPGGPARNVTGGITQGNLGLGSQHSQVQPSVYQLPDKLPVPNNPEVHVPPQPTWPTGNQLSPDVISQFALRNRISFKEALDILQKRMPPPQLQPQQVMPPPGQ